MKLDVRNIWRWPLAVFTEPDGNGGKASFSRVFGAFVIIKIVAMAEAGKTVPEAMMTLFWVLVGYQLLSKALNSLSPAVIDIARAKLMGSSVTPPTPPQP
jgi:hypothetical protein